MLITTKIENYAHLIFHFDSEHQKIHLFRTLLYLKSTNQIIN